MPAAPHSSDVVLPPGAIEASSDTDAFTLVIGQGDERAIGPYRLLKTLGRGGMGVVFLAEAGPEAAAVPGTRVALKVLRKVTGDERRRFDREVRYLESLRHPGIVRMLDHGEHAGYPYLVMALVEGRRLDQLIEHGQRLPESRCIDVIIGALEALHAAHLAGILHRDLKPNNIMVGPGGQVMLLDFGLAQSLDNESRMTRTGNVIGTPAYMPPEQAAGARHDLSVRSDVYAMGACLYELVTGFQPFTADNSMAVLRRIIEEPVLPPSQLRAGMSPGLETAVLVAMAKEPRDRYPTAEAMADDLRRLRDGRPVRGRTPAWWRRAWRTVLRQRRHYALLSLLLFVPTSAAVLGLRAAWRRPPPPPAVAVEVADTWITELSQELPLDPFRNTLTTYPPLGREVRLAQLPAVTGPVRLHCQVRLPASGQVQLMIADRDVGQGYRLQVSRDQDGDRMVLLREDLVVASRELGAGAGDRPLELVLERDAAGVEARLDDLPPLRFLDLTPIEGPAASAVYIAFAPGVEVAQVLLERRRPGLYVSALTPADVLRQDGRYASALKQYEAFLRDHPDAPEARDAWLRSGLCLEALGDQEGALPVFIQVARRWKDEPAYAAVANFHAWSCLLRLGRWEEAEARFAAIRRDYDLVTLLRAVPQDTVSRLLSDYLRRAEELAPTQADRAAGLYATASELGVFLKQPDAIARGQLGAGDVLAGQDKLEEARVMFEATSRDQRLNVPQRQKAVLKLAEVERLLDLTAAAERHYREVMENPGLEDDLAQWARLWLGDLLLERGQDARALALWSNSSESISRAGAIMAALSSGAAGLPTSEDRFFMNDSLYFEARLALLRGDQVRYREGLEQVIRLGPARDWPTPLAAHLLNAAAP